MPMLHILVVRHKRKHLSIRGYTALHDRCVYNDVVRPIMPYVTIWMLTVSRPLIYAQYGILTYRVWSGPVSNAFCAADHLGGVSSRIDLTTSSLGGGAVLVHHTCMQSE